MPSAGCEFSRFQSRFVFLTPSGISGRKELASSLKTKTSNAEIRIQNAKFLVFTSAFLLLTSDFVLTSYFTLLNNLRDRARAHRMSTFTDGKAQAFLHRHRRDQLNHQLHIVARHHHLRSRGQLSNSGHVSRSQIKLRTVSLEERRM